jgi:hypothetical protein
MIDSIIGFWSSPIVRGYLISGIAFMVLIDILVNVWLIRKQPELTKPYRSLGLQERILMILLWPWMMYTFANGWWKSYDKKD